MIDNFEDENIIDIILEDGSEISCVSLLTFEVGDKNYIAMIPVEEIDNEEPRTFFYRYEEDEDGNPSLGNIETDDEFEDVVAEFDNMLYDMEEFGDLEDIDDL